MGQQPIKWAQIFLFWVSFKSFLLWATPTNKYGLVVQDNCQSNTQHFIVVIQRSKIQFENLYCKRVHLTLLKKGWREKNSTLLLLVTHFEINLSNCVARTSPAVLTNFRKSRYSALTIRVDRPPLVSLRSSQLSHCPVLSIHKAKSSAVMLSDSRQPRCPIFVSTCVA